MKHFNFKGKMCTVNELSEMSGIAPHTLRDRLRRGYTVEEAVKMTATHDSIKEFAAASWYQDWIGMPVDDLYTIYWKWCVSHNYQVFSKQGFSRQLLGLYPMLKTVPTKRGSKNQRVIRMRG